MKITKTLAVVAASGAMLAATALPALAANTTVHVSGNGAFSTNGVVVSNNNSSSVKQSNTTTTINVVDQHANTGGNSASFNTGGSSTIGTGGVTQTTNITNGGNANIAAAPCGCNTTGNTTATVSGNGDFSYTGITVLNSNTSTVTQGNVSFTSNSVGSHANTGHNSTSFNTSGSNGIQTGAATQTTNITNYGGVNALF